jgi:hypothetical protein
MTDKDLPESFGESLVEGLDSFVVVDGNWSGLDEEDCSDDSRLLATVWPASLAVGIGFVEVEEALAAMQALAVAVIDKAAALRSLLIRLRLLPLDSSSSSSTMILSAFEFAEIGKLLGVLSSVEAVSL